MDVLKVSRSEDIGFINRNFLSEKKSSIFELVKDQVTVSKYPKEAIDLWIW